MPQKLAIFDEWMQDPEFAGLPVSDKKTVLENYFNGELADDEFRALPQEEQTKIKGSFFNDHLGVQAETKEKVESITDNSNDRVDDWGAGIEYTPDETRNAMVVPGLKHSAVSMPKAIGQVYKAPGEIGLAAAKRVTESTEVPPRQDYQKLAPFEMSAVLKKEDEVGHKLTDDEYRNAVLQARKDTAVEREAPFKAMKKMGDEHIAYYEKVMEEDPDIKQYTDAMKGGKLGFIEKVAGSLGETAAGVGLSFVPVVGPLAAGAMFFGLEKDEVYTQSKQSMLKKGKSEAEAEQYAQNLGNVVGVWNGMMELIGIGPLVQAFKPAKALVKEILHAGASVVTEGTTEGIQGVSTKLANEWAARPDGEPAGAFFNRMLGKSDEFASEFWENASVGGVVGGGVHAGGRVASTVFDEFKNKPVVSDPALDAAIKQGAAMATDRTTQLYNDLLDGGKATPDVLKRFLSKIDPGHPVAQDIKKVLGELSADSQQENDIIDLKDSMVAGSGGQLIQDERAFINPGKGWKHGTEVVQEPMDRLKVKLAGREIGKDAKFIPESGYSAIDSAQAFEDNAAKFDRIRQSLAGAEGLKKQLAEKEKESFAAGELRGRAPYLEKYLNQLKDGQPGVKGATEPDHEGQRIPFAFGSSYPKWLQHSGFDSETAIKAIDRGLTGMPFPEAEKGKGQSTIWDAAYEAAGEERDRDLWDFAKLIEESPENVKYLNDYEYKALLELLEKDNVYTDQITEAAAKYRGTAEGKAIAEIGKEQGFSEEEIQAILNDPNEPDVSLESIWAEIGDENREWLNEQDRIASGKPTGPRSGAEYESEDGTIPQGKVRPSVEKESFPTPEPPTAMDRLRGKLYGKKGRFVEVQKEAKPTTIDEKEKDIPLTVDPAALLPELEHILKNKTESTEGGGIALKGMKLVNQKSNGEYHLTAKGLKELSRLRREKPSESSKKDKMRVGHVYPVEGHEGVKYTIYKNKDRGMLHPEEFKVVLQRKSPFVSIVGYGNTVEDARDSVITQFNQKIASEKPQNISEIETAIDKFFSGDRKLTKAKRKELETQKRQIEKAIASGVFSDDELTIPRKRLAQINSVLEPEVKPKPEKSALKKASDMTADELLAEWDRQAAEVEAKETPKAESIPSPKQKAQESAQHIASAIDKFKQINDILGDKGSLSNEVDERKWELIRPLLKEAWDDIVSAGKAGADFVKLAMENLSPKGRPYFAKFVKEEMEGKDETGRPENKPGTVGMVEGEIGVPSDVRAPEDRGSLPEQPEKAVPGIEVGSTESAPVRGQAGDEQKPGGGPGEGNRDGLGVSDGRGTKGTPGRKSGDENQGVVEVSAGKPGGRKEDGENKGIAEEDRNHRIADDDVIVPSGAETKIRANIAAIRLVKKLQSENRNPTPTEKKTLAQYVGWGQFSQKIFKSEFSNLAEKHGDKPPQSAFPQYGRSDSVEKYNQWVKKYGKALHPALGGAMTTEEWTSAETSTINAHYTTKPIIKAMWSLADRLGFTGGSVLEPAGGIGHFFGLMPERMANQSNLYGVEKDILSGQIFQKLYPQAKVEISPFERSKITMDNSMDLVISNVPFANVSIKDKNHPAYSGWSLHNYYFGRMLTAAKPGGLVIAITSSWSMDAKSNAKIRDYLSGKADLVGAIRLPNTAFKENAGTDVVTDIIVFRKKGPVPVSFGKDFSATQRLHTPENQKLLAEFDREKALLDGMEANKLPKGSSARVKKLRLDGIKIQKAKLSEVMDELQAAYKVNEYFINHPTMVIGKHSMKGTMYAKDSYTVDPTGDLIDQINSAIQAFPENIVSGNVNAPAQPEKWAETTDKEGTLTREDGKIYLIENGRMVAPTYMNSKGKEFKITEPVKIARLNAYMDVRESASHLLDLMDNPNVTDPEIKAQQKDLNKAYDKFVKKYKAFGENANNWLADVDANFGIVDALEVEKKVPGADSKDKTFEKADIFTKRTKFPFKEPTKADNLEDAVNMSIVYRGSIDPGYVGVLIGQDNVESIINDVVEAGHGFVNPETGMLEQKDLYLSGNVKRKLIQAEAAAGAGNDIYKKNIEALKPVIPEDIDIEFVSFRFGSTWLPPECIQDFMQEFLDVGATVAYNETDYSGRWRVNPERNVFNTKNKETYGTEDTWATDLITDALNFKRAKIMRTEEDENGNKRKYEDKDASKADNLKTQELNEHFVRWAKTHDKWAKDLTQIYNDEKNGIVLRKHIEPKIDHYPGASTVIKLRPHQKIAVSRALNESVLLAYGVGTGKTFIFITAAMEMKRIGTAKKPVIVVHNSTIDQYRKSFQTLYPGAKVLIPNFRQRSARMRKKTLASMATGDWDAIVLPQSFFDGIANDPEREAAFVEDRISEMDLAIAEATEEEGEKSFTVKDMVKAKERRRQKLADLLARRKDETITFEEMGIDAMLIDEAHAYKRSEFFTKLNKVKGIDSGSSQRSTSLILKSETVRRKTGGKNVITATGTPISNTMAELWTMLRYVRPDLLEEYGVTLFDSFAGTFGNIVEGLEETPSGFKEIDRFAEYVNGPELLTMFFSGADVRLTKDADLNLPKIKGGNPEAVICEPSSELKKYMKDILVQWKDWENLPGKEKRKLRHVPLVLYGLAKKAAIDLRLVDPGHYTFDPGGKVGTTIDKTFRIWKGSKSVKGAQIIFMDSFQDNAKTPAFNAHKDIRQRLIMKGVPAKEICLFGTLTEKQMDNAKASIRAGEIRVVIGTTQKLGIGVDIADKMVAAHHISVPDRPMDIEQRNGRVIRQTNENPEVEIINYCAKDTMDSVLFHRLYKKQRFTDQILNGDIEGRTFADPFSEEQVSFAEFAAASSGEAGKLLFEKNDLKAQEHKYKIAETAYIRQISGAKAKVRTIPKTIEEEKTALVIAKERSKRLEEMFPDGKLDTIAVDGKSMERSDFTALLEKKTAEIKKYWDDHYDGMKMADFAKHNSDPNLIEADAGDVHISMSLDINTNYNAYQAIRKPSSELSIANVRYANINFTMDGKPFGRGYTWVDPANLKSLFTRKFNDSLSLELERPDRITNRIQDAEEELAEFKNIAGTEFRYTNELADLRKRISEIDRELIAISDEVAGDGEVESFSDDNPVKLSMTKASKTDKVTPMTSKKGPGEIPTKDASVSPEGGEFKDSEVVNRDGSLKMVYHGGNGPIESFKDSPGRGWLGVAYFSENNETAERYAYGGGIDLSKTIEEYKDEQKWKLPDRVPHVTKAYLNIKKPLDLDSASLESMMDGNIEAAKDQLNYVFDRQDLWIDDGETDLNKLQGDEFWEKLNEFAENSDAFADEDTESLKDNDIARFAIYTGLLDRAVENGQYDGVTYYDQESESTAWVPFKTDQIKILPNQSRPSTEEGQPPTMSSMGKTTPRNAQNLEQLKKDVLTWLKDILPHEALIRVRAELAPKLDLKGRNTELSTKQWKEIDPTLNTVMGAATVDHLKALIELSYAFDNKTIQENTYHEAFHVVTKWLLPDADYARLLKFYGNEEAAAVAFQKYAMLRAAGKGHELGKIRQIFAKIIQALKAIRNGLKGKGFRGPETVFGKIWGKEYGMMDEDARLGRAAGVGTVAMSVASNDLLRELESGKKIKVYRAMQLIDGNLYPPMSAKVNGKLRTPTKLNEWEQAVENPELAKDGKFKLNKANKASIAARYNPYFHTSASPLNDQFTSAYKRPNLVTVEVEIPESELTSGYKAEGAKDAVGEMPWHSGPVSSKLPKNKQRTVILSRYVKPIRIVPDSEVADRITELLEGEGLTIPGKVITPSLKKELVKRGISVTEAPTVKPRMSKQKPHTMLSLGRPQQDLEDFVNEVLGREAEEAAPLTGGTPTVMPIIRGILEKYGTADQWESFATYLWDQDAAIKRVQKEIPPQPETRDYALLKGLLGKKLADEIKLFDRDRLQPLLKDMADSKVKIEDIQELLHADHAPERNLQMKRVNARRYIDATLQQMTDAEAQPYKDRIVEISDDFMLNSLLNNDSSINDRRDDYVALMDELSGVGIGNNIKEQLSAKRKDFDKREFTPEEIEKGTREFLQKRLDNAQERLERFTQITDQWADVKDRLSGMTDERSDEIKDKWSGNEDINRIADTIRSINSDSLDILHKAGEVSNEEYYAMNAAYSMHVPLMREGYMEGKPSTGRQGYGPLAKPLKIAYGSTRGVENIFAHVIDRYQSAVTRKHKLEAGKALYEMVKENPDDGRWSITKLPKKPRYDAEGNIRMYDDHGDPGPDAVYVKVGGTKYMIQVPHDNPSMMRFMEAVKRERSDLGPVTQFSRKIVQFLAALNTSFSPEFLMTNFMRDLPTAMIHLETIGGAEGSQKAVAKNVKAAIQGIYKAERGDESSDMAKLYREFAKHGGAIGWMQSYDTTEKLAKHLEKELAYAEGKYPNKAKLLKLGKWIKHMNIAVENGVRLSAYKVMVEHGLTKSKAAKAASGLTIDFTQHGTVGPIINSFYMFANAGIQGNVRMITAVATNKNVQKIAVGIVGFGAIANIIGAMLGGDDDDGESYYDKMKRTNPSLFERNMIFMIPGSKGRYIKIPMPYGYNTFFVLGNELAGTIRGKSTVDGMSRICSAILGSLNPLASATLLQTVVPTIGDPIAQVSENKTWFGGPLMPEKNPFGIPAPDSERYFKTVNPVAKYAAKGMNRITGGNKFEPGFIDVSPETIEMVFETFTGSAGKLAKDALSLPVKAMSDDGITLNKIPFVRKFISSQSPYADNAIYRENSTKIDIFIKRFENTDDAGRKELRKNPLSRIAGTYKMAESSLRSLNKYALMAEKAGKDAEIKKAKDEMIQVKRRFNKIYNKAIAAPSNPMVRKKIIGGAR